MIEHDHPHPFGRLLGLAVAGGGAAGVLHGFHDRLLTALVGALVTTAFAVLLELARPTLRRKGERFADRVHGPPPPPSPPTSAA